jgi:hypothetical protein
VLERFDSKEELKQRCSDRPPWWRVVSGGVLSVLDAMLSFDCKLPPCPRYRASREESARSALVGAQVANPPHAFVVCRTSDCRSNNRGAAFPIDSHSRPQEEYAVAKQQLREMMQRHVAQRSPGNRAGDRSSRL